MRLWCCDSQGIYVGDVGIYFVSALCMDLIIDADVMETYSVYICRLLDKLFGARGTSN